ncbi:MAG: type II toxin-antitoxin system PemK/MazF family toxin, partial [Marinirhabdus sp.]
LKNYHNNLILNPTEKNGLSKRSEVMPIHIRAIAKERLKTKLGYLTVPEINKITEGLYKIIKY